MGSSEIFAKTKRIQFVACGTSLHAGKVGRFWFEEIAGIPCYVDFASEYRYRNPLVEDGTLFVTISQSGETADTLAALRYAKDKDYLSTLSICNVPTSSLARESDHVLFTNAGPEALHPLKHEPISNLCCYYHWSIVAKTRIQSPKSLKIYWQVIDVFIRHKNCHSVNVCYMEKK